MFSIGNQRNSDLIARIGYTGIIFLPVAFYESICVYLNVKTRTVRWLYLLGVLFVITLWTTNGFVTGYHSYDFGNYPKAGFIHVLYMGMVIFVFLKMISLFHRLSKHETEKDQWYQLQWMYLGLLIYSIAIIDYALNYPRLLELLHLRLYPAGVFFIIFSILTFIFAHITSLNASLQNFTPPGPPDFKC